jgi:hypothetical protein
MSALDSRLDKFMRGISHASSSILGKTTGFFKTRERYRLVFSSPEGREVLRHIIKMGRVHKSTYSKADRDLTLIREGERRLALTILRMSCKDFDELQQLIEETHDAS